MRSFQVDVPATGTSLYELIDYEIDRCNGLLLQAPLTNTDKIYFGEHGREFFEMINGGAVGLDVTNLRDIFIKGNVADKLNILVS